MGKLRVALCQTNSVVGDIAHNTAQILEWLKAANDAHCHVAVFPELALVGYPPEDLLLKKRFVEQNRKAMADIAAASDTCVAVVGFVDADNAGHRWNAAGIAGNAKLLGVYHKQELPNYGVFDERRYFSVGLGNNGLHNIGNVNIGISICEDVWIANGPLLAMSASGAEIIFCLNASPYHATKPAERLDILGQRAHETGCAIVYVNLVGGQDELVFDGGSLVISADGEVIARGLSFKEQMLIAEVEVKSDVANVNGYAAEINFVAPKLKQPEEQYEALVLATRDYVHKNNFSDVGIGLSGGIDSSLVAVIAADALGPNHVHGVLMPSRYSSDHSVKDAQALCENLGIEQRVIPIEPAHEAFLEMLKQSFHSLAEDLTEENIQSRIRGTLLMALSNKFGWLILTTGNKSESAVGYSTLYGDTAGAYAVIKDLWKTQVYAFAQYRNQRDGTTNNVIPASVLTKPPSAELRPDQRDDQSLPPYDVLDPLLEAYVEDDLTLDDLCQQGFEVGLVTQMIQLVDRAEYKRRQNPPGVRITAKAFGRDRRLPITNRYRGHT